MSMLTFKKKLNFVQFVCLHRSAVHITKEWLLFGTAFEKQHGVLIICKIAGDSSVFIYISGCIKANFHKVDNFLINMYYECNFGFTGVYATTFGGTGEE